MVRILGSTYFLSEAVGSEVIPVVNAIIPVNAVLTDANAVLTDEQIATAKRFCKHFNRYEEAHPQSVDTALKSFEKKEKGGVTWYTGECKRFWLNSSMNKESMLALDNMRFPKQQFEKIVNAFAERRRHREKQEAKDPSEVKAEKALDACSVKVIYSFCQEFNYESLKTSKFANFNLHSVFTDDETPHRFLKKLLKPQTGEVWTPAPGESIEKQLTKGEIATASRLCRKFDKYKNDEFSRKSAKNALERFADEKVTWYSEKCGAVWGKKNKSMLALADIRFPRKQFEKIVEAFAKRKELRKNQQAAGADGLSKFIAEKPLDACHVKVIDSFCTEFRQGTTTVGKFANFQLHSVFKEEETAQGLKYLKRLLENVSEALPTITKQILVEEDNEGDEDNEVAEEIEVQVDGDEHNDVQVDVNEDEDNKAGENGEGDRSEDDAVDAAYALLEREFEDDSVRTHRVTVSVLPSPMPIVPAVIGTQIPSPTGPGFDVPQPSSKMHRDRPSTPVPEPHIEVDKTRIETPTKLKTQNPPTPQKSAFLPQNKSAESTAASEVQEEAGNNRTTVVAVVLFVAFLFFLVVLGVAAKRQK